jgi:hypothetical protein
MRRCRHSYLAVALLGLSGCLWDDPHPGSARFGANGNVPSRDKLPPAPVQESSRVDSLGRQILAANPDLTIRPMFLAVGTPKVSAFHRGTTELYVSSGLVNKCASDAELAAVLCSELGKMVAENQPQRRLADREPPFAPRIGNDAVGGSGDPDQTRRAEQAMWEQRNPRRPDSRVPTTAEPTILATAYLTKAGFSADDLTKVGPLLRQAESEPIFEQQLTAPRTNGLGIPK